MKKIILYSMLALFGFVGQASASDVNTSVTGYDVEAYDYADSTRKFGIIRLVNNGTVVAYLHFHRSSTTMPTDRLYTDGANRVHSHYYSSDWERILALLDHQGTLFVSYDSYYDTMHLTRGTTVN